MVPPVFIVGCPRSGTTLLFHMLLSAGGFADYRNELRIFDLIAPRYRNLSSERDRRRFLDMFLSSHVFRRLGIDPKELSRRVLDRCSSSSDLLKILMEMVCEQQGVVRWAECTPMNVLFMPEIKKAFPNARFLHVIRDGRDVALSLDRMGWIQPATKRGSSLLSAGLYWSWIIRRGLRDAPALAPDYMSVRFEDLIKQPERTLSEIGDFIQHDLSLDRIQRIAIGSVRDPNTSFEGSAGQVGRWREILGANQLCKLEEVVGETLENLGYHRDTTIADKNLRSLKSILIGSLYRTGFSLKHILKHHTLLGGLLVNDSRLKADQSF